MNNSSFTANKIKLAVSTADTAPDTAPLPLLGNICENLETAHKLGYSAIEVHTRENVEFNYEEILNKCGELGMRLSAIVTGRLYNQEKVTLIDDDRSKVQIAMQGMKKYIDIAQKLETDIIVGWIKGVLPDKNCAGRYEKRLADNLKELALYALGKGVKVYVECLNRYETNYLNTGSELASFIKANDIPNTYVHLDTFHMNIEEENIAEAIKICGDKLGYIHFADSNRNYPGAGHIEFTSIIKALEEINYDGYIVVECLPRPDGKTAAEKALNYLKSL